MLGLSFPLVTSLNYVLYYSLTQNISCKRKSIWASFKVICFISGRFPLRATLQQLLPDSEDYKVKIFMTGRVIVIVDMYFCILIKVVVSSALFDKSPKGKILIQIRSTVGKMIFGATYMKNHRTYNFYKRQGFALSVLTL